LATGTVAGALGSATFASGGVKLSDFMDAGGAFRAMVATEVDDDLADEAEAAESDVEGEALEFEVSVEEAERRPRSSVANADGVKNANSMAHAMASLKAPPDMSAERVPVNKSDCSGNSGWNPGR
jgi:hypothetical protein